MLGRMSSVSDLGHLRIFYQHGLNFLAQAEAVLGTLMAVREGKANIADTAFCSANVCVPTMCRTLC